MSASHPYAGIAARYIKVRGDRQINDFDDALAFHGCYGDNARVGARTDTVHLRVTEWAKSGLPSAITIRIYNTDIVTYYDDGTALINHGGRVTPTTVNRISQFGPIGWYFASQNRKLTAYHASLPTVICNTEVRLKVYTP
jgi:hypothetical protein